MENKRYFYLVYIYSNKQGCSGTGSCHESGNNYINLDQSVKWIKEREGFDQVVITNIIEMTKDDYEQFIK